jgi:hypothetical protein
MTPPNSTSIPKEGSKLENFQAMVYIENVGRKLGILLLISTSEVYCRGPSVQ